jgi:hypothetical protein
VGSTPTPATNKKGENMSKEEWFEGHYDFIEWLLEDILYREVVLF